MKQQRIHVLVSGKVQGVFFRQALKVVAKKNNVSGWVRNLKDRRVEAVLEGDSKSINSVCLLYTSPSPRDGLLSRMPSSA